ncbi:DNA-(apurinic or apyrimidinic site) endonuclease isoform X2 [Anthonomus grandis grandis]|uniref:DNA-(apurinic or apyrimidinic site) endonuclease isoform X2 n=1 Tax=Anthonomus grandis grandis TaxID=2921223 RepID=UPI0021654B77|nr:DNA-(apurinic or apyrimidinic site) endonuclease isoform X2 [Anthonomus grandis grandis]
MMPPKRTKAAIEKTTKDVQEVPSEEPVKKQTRRRLQKEISEPEEPADEPVKRQRHTKSKKSQVQKSEPEKEEAKKPEVKPTVKGKKTTAKPEAALLNTTESKWDEIDFGCNKTTSSGETYNLKITSWNVDGLRAWFKKGGWNIMEYDKPDIFCLQETKCSDDKLPEEMVEVDGYHAYWCSSKKEGYAGVAVYSKVKPVNVKYGVGDEKYDDEGRCLTLEFEKFHLVNVYVPNAGRGLVTLPKRLEWNEVFKAYISTLDKTKPVIVCGDMNVAHEEIDIANPKSNKKNAGFTKAKREGMTDLLSSGFIDTFREIYPEEKDVYTFWSYMSKARSKNIGWRLDYFIISNRLMKKVCDSVVRNLVYGSDHCPITLFVHI